MFNVSMSIEKDVPVLSLTS